MVGDRSGGSAAEVKRGTVPNIVDERLAWLAVRDELRDESRRARGAGLMRIVRGLNRSPSAAATAEAARVDLVERKMIKFAIVADELVAEFTDRERFMLRATGQVPDWYIDTVKRQAKRVKF